MPQNIATVKKERKEKKHWAMYLWMMRLWMSFDRIDRVLGEILIALYYMLSFSTIPSAFEIVTHGRSKNQDTKRSAPNARKNDQTEHFFFLPPPHPQVGMRAEPPPNSVEIPNQRPWTSLQGWEAGKGCMDSTGRHHSTEGVSCLAGWHQSSWWGHDCSI